MGWGRRTTLKESIYSEGRGGHRTYLFGVGTLHIPYRGGDTEQHLKKKLSSGWLGGSILQAETCQILSLAENPRWSLVWQYGTSNIEVVGWPV